MLRFFKIFLTVASLAALSAVAGESICVPVNAGVFKVRQQNGSERFFIRDSDEPNVMFSKDGWRGFIRPERNMVNVETIPGMGRTHLEYCFVGGHLRFMSEGGKDTEVRPKSSQPKHASVSAQKDGRRNADIKALWPAEKLTLAEKIDSDIWRGAGRFRPLSGNPNRDAAVFGGLALLALGLVFAKWGWFVRAAGVLMTGVLVYATLITESRSGISGLLLGLLVMSFFQFRRLIKWKVVLLTLSFIVIVIAGLSSMKAFGTRFSPQGVLAEFKKGDRLPIWREVPRMVATAPLGWGLWRSGPAYNDWFESPHRNYTTGDLFNDHLSRFVEGGWPFGGLYVLIWMMSFFFFGRMAIRGGTAVPLGVTVAFAVAIMSNPVVYWAPSLILPLSMIFLFVCSRPWRDFRGYARALLGAVISTACVLGGVAAMAFAAPPSDIPMHVGLLGKQIVAGGTEARVWVSGRTDAVLDGDFYGFLGKGIRRFYREHPEAEPIGLVEHVVDLPKSMHILVLAGKTGNEFLAMSAPDRPKADIVIFLSPPFGYEHIDEEALDAAEVHYVTGEFVAETLGLTGETPDWVHVVPGAELYIPGWLQSVVQMKGKKGKNHEE